MFHRLIHGYSQNLSSEVVYSVIKLKYTKCSHIKASHRSSENEITAIKVLNKIIS